MVCAILPLLNANVLEDLNEDRTIPVCFEEMYEVIADFGRGLESDRTARVSTKYKTVDQKVRPVAAPLPGGQRVPNQRGCVGPQFTRSGLHRTHLHRRDAPGAQNRWGRVPTADGGECSEGTGKPSHSHRKRSGA